MSEDKLKEEQVNSALLIEAIITLLENAPLLLMMLQKQGELTSEEAARYRARLQAAMSRLDKTWEDYLEEARRIKEGLDNDRA